MKKQQITLLTLLVVAAAFAVGCGNSNVPTFKQLPFISNRTVTPATSLFVMNLDGSGLTPVAAPSGSAYSPSNSANAQTVAFANSGNVWSSNASGSSQTQLTTFDDQTQWAFEARISPNGKKIVYAMYDDSVGYDTVWIVNADGTGAINLNATLPTGMTGCYNGSFSADSSKVVYACYGPSSTYGLYVVKANGTGTTTVTTQNFFMDTPAFSPDGKQILFVQFGSGPSANRVPGRNRARTARRTSAPTVNSAGITSINLDGSNVTVVVPGSSLYEVEVLNHSLYYTFYDSGLGLYQIYKANLDGTGAASISDGTAYDYLGLSAD